MKVEKFGDAQVKPEGKPVVAYALTEGESKKTCWSDMIGALLPKREKILHCSLKKSEMLEKFTDKYGAPCGKPFIAYSQNWVFFPTVYDGRQEVGMVPRNPGKKYNYTPKEFGGGSYWEQN